MKTSATTIALLLSVINLHAQFLENFSNDEISGSTIITDTGLTLSTSDTFISWLSSQSGVTDLNSDNVTLSAPIPHVFFSTVNSYIEFTPTDQNKVLSDVSFDLWYSNSESGTTLQCDCKSYDESNNLLQTITKSTIAFAYNFEGTPKKIKCTLTEPNTQNAVFIDNISFGFANETTETNPFAINSTNASGIESSFSNNSTGNYSFSVGIGNTASGEHASALGQETNASGLSSFTSGYLTTASGTYSTALGNGTTSSGNNTFSSGAGTTASGDFSTATGYMTTASGMYSTAMGSETTSSDYNSLVLGQWNLAGSTVTNGATSFSLENTAFVIGNGTNNDNRGDALVVKFNGDTTLAGTVTATSFIGDGSGLTGLPNQDYDLLNNIPIELYDYNSLAESGIQSRTSTASGLYSFAVGNNGVSSGTHSFSYGNSNQATGNGSFAGGSNNVTSGLLSTAFGTSNEAQTDYSIAAGYGNTSSGYAAVTFGFLNTTSGNQGFSVGTGNTASGAQSIAIGSGNTSSGVVSTALGSSTTSSGKYATTTGKGTVSSGYGSMAIGTYNIENSSDSVESYDASNTAFVIGNGIESNPDSNGNTTITRSDAFKVLFDGTTTIAGDLNINSDVKLKANIISLGSTLTKLLQIDGKKYTLKKDINKKEKIGLLAQDIEKVFPELVSENNGIKSVNYQGLVPVMINALKEQHQEIEELKSLVRQVIGENLSQKNP